MPAHTTQGLFVLSVGMVAEKRNLLGAALFATLLNFKHIFVYAGPVYFVHLLRHYCRLSWGGLQVGGGTKALA